MSAVASTIEQAWGMRPPRNLAPERHAFVGGHELILHDTLRHNWRVVLNDVVLAVGDYDHCLQVYDNLTKALSQECEKG
jgi:hypothetical protein